MAYADPALLDQFRRIAHERIRNATAAIDRLVGEPDNAELMREALREFHTLKSEAMIVSYDAIRSASHKTEELLLFADRQEVSQRRPLFNLAMAGIDIIAALLGFEPDSCGAVVDLPGFLTRVDAVVAGETDVNGRVGTRSAAVAPRPAPRPLSTDGVAACERAQGAELVRLDLAWLDRLTGVVGDCLTAQQGIEAALGRLQATANKWRDRIAERGSHDALMAERTSEIPEIRGLVSQGQKILSAERRVLDEALREIARAANDIRKGRRAVAEMDGSVRQMRLVPLSNLLNRYPRSVRTMARDQGKVVVASIRGEDAEIDRHVLEEVSEPLLHLVRNAVAHGIETPEERSKIGKGPTGTITLIAARASGFVEVRIRDDGRGLDEARIRKVAVARGICSAQEIADWSREQVLSLVFCPGFSTCEVADDVSGRGIGLDVVKERIEGLGGQVRMSTEQGLGTEFVLHVPVSLVLGHVLVLRVGETYVGVAAEALARIIRICRGDVTELGGKPVVPYGDKLVPLLDLPEVFFCVEHVSHARAWTEAPVVLAQHGSILLALRVDGVVGQRQVLQRPLEPVVRGLSLFTGTVQLESGEHIPMLNLAEVAKQAANADYKAASLSLSIDQPERTVMIVEDSELIRDVIVGMLHRAGSRVIEAVNGREALEKLQQELPDLILTDLEMPVMDGFELLRQLQSNEELAEIPVVVLTTRGSNSDKKRALDLGAHAYLLKSGFEESDLLAVVDRHIRTLAGG